MGEAPGDGVRASTVAAAPNEQQAMSPEDASGVVVALTVVLQTGHCRRGARILADTDRERDETAR